MIAWIFHCNSLQQIYYYHSARSARSSFLESVPGLCHRFPILFEGKGFTADRLRLKWWSEHVRNFNPKKKSNNTFQCAEFTTFSAFSSASVGVILSKPIPTTSSNWSPGHSTSMPPCPVSPLRCFELLGSEPWVKSEGYFLAQPWKKSEASRILGLKIL